MISPMISLPLFEAQPKNKWGEKSCTHGLDPWPIPFPQHLSRVLPHYPILWIPKLSLLHLATWLDNLLKRVTLQKGHHLSLCHTNSTPLYSASTRFKLYSLPRSANFVHCKSSKMFSALNNCYYKACTHHFIYSLCSVLFWWYFCWIYWNMIEVWYFYLRWIYDNFFGFCFFWVISEFKWRSKLTLNFKDFLFARIWGEKSPRCLR